MVNGCYKIQIKPFFVAIMPMLVTDMCIRRRGGPKQVRWCVTGGGEPLLEPPPTFQSRYEDKLIQMSEYSMCNAPNF